MDGGRDTEIAMGAFQPNHLSAATTQGQIHGFRLSLWYEHTRDTSSLFDYPESLECIQKVTQIADKNWQSYKSSGSHEDLESHLLRYPLEINNDGKLRGMMEHFPDTTAPIMGKTANYLQPIITT